MMMYNAKAYSAASATSQLASTTIPRRGPTEHDVQIEILFCGICHSDLHQVLNEWSGVMPTVYPIVPGHEIVGRVTKVGSEVNKYKPGDLAAVGCLVDSDRTCPQCKAGLEQFCPSLVLTYNGPDKYLGGVTYGGYSNSIVVDEHFVLSVPGNLELAGAGPLLCAGITTYSPMRHWGVSKGKKVGVVGLGGLGHMAVIGRSHRVIFLEGIEREDHVVGRHRPSIMPFGLRPQAVDHEGEIVGMARRLGECTILGRDFVERRRHQLLVDERDCPCELAFDSRDNDVEIVKSTHGDLTCRSALRRIGIDVIEPLEVGGIFDIAEQRQRVAPGRLAGGSLCAGGIDDGKFCREPQRRGKRGGGGALQKMSTGDCQMRNSCCGLSSR